MVSVERVSGSQLPVLVTTLTFQSPSYGDWAIAGAAVPTAHTAASLIVNREPDGWYQRVGPRDPVTYMGGDVNIAAWLKPKWLGLTFEN